MKILFVASEAVPFCKTGGLADVIGALPGALARERHSVALVLPFYRQIKESKFPVENLGVKVPIPLAKGIEHVDVFHMKVSARYDIYFVGSDKYFNRLGLYGDRPGTAYDDNHLRYALLSRAALEIARGVNFKPDVIHCHDWQTGLLPAFLKTTYRTNRFFSNTASLFTIHNMAYQGHFHKDVLESTGLTWEVYHHNGIEFYGGINFLKAGLSYTDAISTVSETYAKEIQTTYEYGYGLEGVLRTRQKRLRGIVNGLDTKVWDPSNDEFLAENYDAASPKNRFFCKADLQRSVRIEQNNRSPLYGFVGRLDYQKGIDFLIEIAPALVQKGAQIIFVGVGEEHYQNSLRRLGDRFPSQIHAEANFAEPLAHKIYGGADYFLMPSKYEPCGLGQLIAMRYGALPIVTPTGGLIDTVTDMSKKNGTGFVASDKSLNQFHDTAVRALWFYKNQNEFTDAQRRAMTIDFSWKKSVESYVQLYRDSQRWRSESVI